MSVHSNDCPECGIELCEHSSNNPVPAEKLETVKAYAEGLRIWGTTPQVQIANDILSMIGAKP